MKKLIGNFLLLVTILFASHSLALAGIPIEEQAPIPAEKTITSQTPQKENKVSKLKQKIVKRILHKKLDNETRTAAIIMAILIPFVGVAIWQDGITKDFWITLLLTALLYLPGLIYALTIILNGPSY